MNIYVGNLARAVTEGNLLQAFKAFGRVEAIRIIKDKISNEPKGFGFVEMADKAEAQSAINGLNGKEFKGRMLLELMKLAPALKAVEVEGGAPSGWLSIPKH